MSYVNSNIRNSVLNSSENLNLVGWTLENSGRGSLSVLTSCFFTIFICTWTVIHARITRRTRDRLLYKVILCLKAIVAPEFIAVEGLQEWKQAQQMIKACQSSTGGRLVMIHAFYVGMLGLRYRSEKGEKVIWPNQMCWLLSEGLLKWDDHAALGLSKEMIRDKSNADTTVKLFALVQVSWFVAQSIMRVAHKLPLSQLETMTLSYIPLYAVTYVFWWTKPKDIPLPSVIDLPSMSADQAATFEHMSIDSAFDGEDTDRTIPLATAWKLTPRMFEKAAMDKAEQEDEVQSLEIECKQDDDPERLQITSKNGSFKDEHMRKGPRERTQGSISISTPRADQISFGPSPLQTRHTTGGIRQAPHVIPSVRRAMTARPERSMIDIQRVRPTLLEQTLRRATTGFWTAQSRISTEKVDKNDRIIPLRSHERVVAYWDPDVYYSKLWPLCCLFGVSFPALHLLSWHSAFPSLIEQWLWRGASLTSIVSMLIFMQYRKVVLKWGGPLVLLSIISPAVYLMSRLVMIAQAFASFRAMDPKVYDTYEVSTYWAHFL